MSPQENKLDEQGTTVGQARAMLQKLRDDAFEASDEKVAIALGRTEQEVTDTLSGSAEFDDDLLMKVRGLAQQRGIDLG